MVKEKKCSRAADVKKTDESAAPADESLPW